MGIVIAVEMSDIIIADAGIAVTGYPVKTC